MKKNTKSILRVLACMLFLLPVPANAAAPNKSDVLRDSMAASVKPIYFGKGEDLAPDTLRYAMSKFYSDQFRAFHDPLAPYFMFISRDANIAMGMGGCVRMRGYFDWGGSLPSPGFAPYLIPMSEDPLRERYFGTTPAGSSLFFRLIGRNRALGDYQVYIEANFNGWNSRDFHLKKAYAVINDWTIGYANSTFSDPGALPPTIDASGPNAKMSATNVLVRWMHAFRHGWSLAASVETPSDQIDAKDNLTAKVEQFIPDVAVFGQWAWGPSDHIRLAGILRSLPYRDLLDQKNHYLVGWGAQLSGVVHPHPSVTLYGMLNGGCGYSSLGGDLLMGKYDLVNNPDRPGRMYAPFSFGGYAAVQYNFTPSVLASATFGGMRYCPAKKAPDSEYKDGLYIAVNAFWYLTPRISCGAEFNLGRRQDMDGRKAWARRVGAMAQFSF